MNSLNLNLADVKVGLKWNGDKQPYTLPNAGYPSFLKRERPKSKKKWANLVSLDSIQHEQSEFKLGWRVQWKWGWNGMGINNLSPYRMLDTLAF